MKKTILLIIIFVMISSIYAERKSFVHFDSMNDSISMKVPISHYSEFSLLQAGLNKQLNFKIGNISGLRLFAGIDGVYNFNSSPRIDHLNDLSITLGAGWEFNIADSGFTVTPQLSGGIVNHILVGDFYMDNNPSTNFFADQLYRFQLELAYTFNSKITDNSSIGLYLSPSLETFPGEKYWGYITGGSIGMRIQFNNNIRSNDYDLNEDDLNEENSLSDVTSQFPVTTFLIDDVSSTTVYYNASLALSVTTGNLTDTSVSWISSDDSIGIIDESGTVTFAYPSGSDTKSVTFTGTSNEDGSLSDSITFTVSPVPVATLSIDYVPITTVYDTASPILSVTTTNMTDTSVSWISSDNSVGTITESGTVTFANLSGSDTQTVIFTATSNEENGVRDWVTFTVSAFQTESVNTDDTDIN